MYMIDPILMEYVERKIKETPELAKNKTKGFRKRRGFFKLKAYIDAFLSGKSDNRLVILSGLRGVGKTTILFQLYNYLRKDKKVEKERILYFSADEVKTYLGKNITDVVTAFIEGIHNTSFVKLKEKLFIFIDEAHFDEKWAEAVKVLYDNTENVFVIVTGSSALLLETTTDTARRAKKELLYPLNFSEYLILKYNIFPPKGTSDIIKNLVFNGPKNLNNAKMIEKAINKKILSLKTTLKNELWNFLIFGGFAFGLENTLDVLERIFDTVERVIVKDLPIVYSFTTKTTQTIKRILTFLSLQKPGGLSDVKLANRLETSPTKIRQILDGLEKTQLIFSVKPYAGAGKIVRKPWKYYFSTPSIPAAIRARLGKLDMYSTETFGVLVENLIASYFWRLKDTFGFPHGVFYDARENGVDFLLYNTFENNVIPVEVGVGKKKRTQIINAIRYYNSEYGILISERELNFDENTKVLTIPLKLFLFL